MTFRELLGMLILYRGATAASRSSAEQYIPELAELAVADLPVPVSDGDKARRWKLEAVHLGDTASFSETLCVCREADLEAHTEAFRARLPFAGNFQIRVTQL